MKSLCAAVIILVILISDLWTAQCISQGSEEGSLVKQEDYDETGDADAFLDDHSSDVEAERFHFLNKNHPLHSLIKKKHPFATFSTVTATSTLTDTVTSSTIGLCASLVNVTGACRLRRGLWVEDPIVLTFDDDMDAIDGALLPSSTLSIETTALPDAITAREKDDHRLSGSVIQPSSISTASGETTELPDEDEEEINSSALKRMFGLNRIFKRKKKIKKYLITVVTTTVTTVTTTTTSYNTVSTKTFFIQLCTPSPFPFSVCPSRKKRQIELEIDHQKSKPND